MTRYAALTDEQKAQRKAYVKEWCRKNPDKKKAYQQTHLAKNREALNERSRRRRQNHPEKTRWSSLRAMRKRAGVHPDDLTGETRDGPCEICGQHAAPLAFDHSHTTHRYRGWLCSQCNQALGMLQDSPAILASAIAYLQQTAPATQLNREIPR